MADKPSFLERLATLDPAVVRGVVVGLVGVIALATGKAINDGVIDTIVNVILLLLPVVAGIFIRKAVTPNAKVIAYKPDPVEQPHVIAAGEATIDNTVAQADDLLDAARTTPQAA